MAEPFDPFRKAVQLDPDANPGAMVALMLTPAQQQAITADIPGRLVQEADHCTLVYLAQDASALTEQKPAIVAALATLAAATAPITAPMNGYGRFAGDGATYPLVLLLDGPALDALQRAIAGCLQSCGVALEERHGFTPHITLSYLPEGRALPGITPPAEPLTFGAISLVWAGERIDLPLLGRVCDDCGATYAGEACDTCAAMEPGEPAMATLGTDAGPAGGFLVAPAPMKFYPSADPYRVRKLGIAWGGHDLVGDTFVKGETDLGRSRPFVGMPVYYDHALGGLKSQIGVVVGAEDDDDGIVFEIELDRNHRYVGDVVRLEREQALGASTGAVGHLVRRKGGVLKRWIVGEISLTPTPAEPRTLAAKSMSDGIAPAAEEVVHMADEQPTTGAPDTSALQAEVKTLRTELDGLKGVRAELDELKAMPAVKKGAAEVAVPVGYNAEAAANLPGGQHHHMKSLFLPGGKAKLTGMYPEGVFGGYVKALWHARKDYGRSTEARKAMRDVYGVDPDGGEEAMKTLNTAQATAGAVLIPEQFIPQLMAVAGASDALYNRATIFPSDGGEMVIPSLDHSGTYVAGQSQYYAGVQITWGDDDAAPGLTEPKFNQIRLKTNSLKARIRVKNSLLQRSAISIDAVLTALLGGAIRYARDYAIVRGTGQGMPQGILGCSAVIDSGGTAVDYATLMLMEARVIPERDANYVWLVHTLRRPDIMALQQTNNTLVTFLPDLRGKPQQVLVGRPIVYTDKLPYVAGASNAADSVMLVDPTMIVGAEFQGIAMAVSDQVRFEDDETVFRVILSFDSQPWLKSAIAISDDAAGTVSGFIKL